MNRTPSEPAAELIREESQPSDSDPQIFHLSGYYFCNLIRIRFTMESGNEHRNQEDFKYVR